MAWRRIGLGLAGLGLGAQQYDTHYRHARFNRNVRAIGTALATVIQYKYVLDRRPEDIDLIHDRVAGWWYDCCCQNGGLYVKLGQSISIMNHVLPAPFVRRFTNLQDQAPAVGADEVLRVFREDFGADPLDIFSEFDETPIASASIAQVHRAVTKEGIPVAVKVQKPYIRDHIPWDLACYRLLVYAFEVIFDLPVYWTVDQVCEQVTKESDFLQEAENTMRAREDLVGIMPDTYVPFIYPELTTKRVMTVEWIDGVKLSNAEAIQSLGFSLAEVMTTATQIFSHQIFVSGFVHGDPHPGNVLVRASPSTGRHEVVVLDHGLYVEESEKFRLENCKLWKSMVLMDTDALRDICRSWGVRDHELFASMQLMKPFKASEGVVHVRRTTRADLLELQLQAKERVKELLADTGLVPQELIILGRAMNIIRANNQAHGSIVNRVSIMADYAARGADYNREQNYRRHSFGSWLTRERWVAAANSISFRLRLWAIASAYYTTQIWRRVQVWWGIGDASGFEDLLEQRLSATINGKLGFTIKGSDPALG